MKNAILLRKIDNLGRFPIPKDIRVKLKIAPKDSYEIFYEEDSIILKKYAPACVFCGEARHTIRFKEKLLCKDCIDDIKNDIFR